MKSSARQRGLTFISMLLILAMAGALVLIGLRLAPIAMDYFTVVSVAKSIHTASAEDRSSKARVRELVKARFSTNNLGRFKPEIIKISFDKQRQLVLTIDYEDRRPMVGNLDVVATFNRTIGAND